MPKDKNSGKKLADMMYGNPEGAAFGVFPQMKPKRSKQDPEAAKNFPVDLGRGAVAGFLGMPADILNLPGAVYSAVTDKDLYKIPYGSEDILKSLPFGTETPAGQFASGIGTIVGGSANLGPAIRGVKAGAKGALAAARAGERMAEKVVPRIMERGGAGADILSGLAQGSMSKMTKAPAIIIPSKIQNVREAVRKSEGSYGAKRVERAADEIRNLEKMYTEKALKEAFTGDNAKAVVTMNPADFEKYANVLMGRTQADIGPKMSELARRGEVDKHTVPTEEYIQHLMRLQGGFDQVPYLNLFKDEVGLPIKPEVRGHEGRHRSRALTEAGEPSALVEINPRGDLREGLPRRSQEEYIEALREELGLSDRLVLPQTDGTSRRPAIILPEPYADGGRVHISDNPDVMQLEVAGAVRKAAGGEITADDLILEERKL